MLHYMQMRNWFFIFIALTITYMIYQKSNATQKYPAPLRAQAFVTNLFNYKLTP